MNLRQAVLLLEAKKRGTSIPAAKAEEAWCIVHQFAAEAKPAAAMVFRAGAGMPHFRLVPVTVVDFYPRSEAKGAVT